MVRTPGIIVQTIKDATIVTIEDNSLLDRHEIERLGTELYFLVEGQARRKLIVDLAKVGHLSSAALSVMLVLRQKVEQVKGELVLCGARREILQLFKMAGLHKLFSFADSEKKALKKLGVEVS